MNEGTCQSGRSPFPVLYWLIGLFFAGWLSIIGTILFMP